MYTLSALLTILPLTSAHFLLTWPARRGFNDDTAGDFPCGGFNDPSSNRTMWPLSGGPIQLDMHHTQVNLQVNLALGNGNGSYSIVLLPTIKEQGVNNFCLGMVNVPSNLGIKEGDNATIQVVTNGDGDTAGLYQVSLPSISQPGVQSGTWKLAEEFKDSLRTVLHIFLLLAKRD
jgi:hypothetical protein